VRALMASGKHLTASQQKAIVKQVNEDVRNGRL